MGYYFDKFIEKIQSIVSDVKKNTYEIKNSSFKLSDITSSTKNSLEVVMKVTEEMEISADNNYRAVDLAKKNIQNFKELSEETFNLSCEAYTKSEKVKDISVNGIKDVKHVLSYISEISLSSSEIQSIIGELESVSKKIQSVVDSIHDLSEQTNLLSLNAAIEASRAGVAGKSFGIVAEEIRKLSTVSADSASSINEIIKEFNTKTNKAFSTFGRVNDIVLESSNKAKVVESVMDNISDNIINISKNIEEIKNHMENQNVVTNQVIDSFEIIEENSNKVNEATNNIKMNIEKQFIDMEKINTATKGQAGISRNLDEVTSSFTV